jgi:hypothetical protein
MPRTLFDKYGRQRRKSFRGKEAKNNFKMATEPSSCWMTPADGFAELLICCSLLLRSFYRQKLCDLKSK